MAKFLLRFVFSLFCVSQPAFALGTAEKASSMISIILEDDLGFSIWSDDTDIRSVTRDFGDSDEICPGWHVRFVWYSQQTGTSRTFYHCDQDGIFDHFEKTNLHDQTDSADLHDQLVSAMFDLMFPEPVD